MAILINGNGNQAIFAAQDADLIASICGGVTSIAQVGNEFAYDLLDANTIGVQDGVILTKEGRRIQLDVDNIDEFVIPNGEQGTTSYYIIGYKLVTDAESKQTAQTFVQLMENGTDTIPEDTFRGGADEVYVSLYRVTQDGLNIDTVDLLLPKFSNINNLKASLTDNGEEFKFGYDSVNDKMGYYKEVGGADTFFPFSTGNATLIKIKSDQQGQVTTDVSTYVSQGATVDNFLLVPTAGGSAHYPGNYVPGGGATVTMYVTKTLSGNTLTTAMGGTLVVALPNFTYDIYYVKID